MPRCRSRSTAPRSRKLLETTSDDAFDSYAQSNFATSNSDQSREIDVETTEFTMGSPSSIPFPLSPGKDEVAMSNYHSLDGSFFVKLKISLVEPNVGTPVKHQSSTPSSLPIADSDPGKRAAEKN